MRIAGRLARIERWAGARTVAGKRPSAADMENVKRTLATVGWLDWCPIKNGWRPVNASQLRAYLRADPAERRTMLAERLSGLNQ